MLNLYYICVAFLPKTKAETLNLKLIDIYSWQWGISKADLSLLGYKLKNVAQNMHIFLYHISFKHTFAPLNVLELLRSAAPRFYLKILSKITFI